MVAQLGYQPVYHALASQIQMEPLFTLQLQEALPASHASQWRVQAMEITSMDVEVAALERALSAHYN